MVAGPVVTLKKVLQLRLTSKIFIFYTQFNEKQTSISVTHILICQNEALLSMSLLSLVILKKHLVAVKLQQSGQITCDDTGWLLYGHVVIVSYNYDRKTRKRSDASDITPSQSFHTMLSTIFENLLASKISSYQITIYSQRSIRLPRKAWHNRAASSYCFGNLHVCVRFIPWRGIALQSQAFPKCPYLSPTVLH